MRIAAVRQYARLAVLECRVMFRSLVVSLATRRMVIGISVLWLVASAIAAALVVSSGPRAMSGDALVTVIVAFSGIQLGVVVAGSSRLLLRADVTQLWRLAPLSPRFAATMPFVVLMAAAAVAVVVVAAPLFGILLLSDSLSFSVLLIAAMILALWATVAAVALAASIAVAKGRQRAADLMQLAVTPLVVAFAAAVRWFASHRQGVDGPTLLVVLLMSMFLLPGALRAAAVRWTYALTTVMPTKRSPAPVWGKIGWFRLLWRTPAPLAVVAAVPLIALTVARTWTPLAIFLVVLPMMLHFHLTRWEDLCPERYQLAPNARRVKRDLFLKVGLPAIVISSTVALVLAISQPRMIVLVALIILGGCTEFISSPGLRRTVQVATVAAGAFVGAIVPV